MEYICRVHKPGVPHGSASQQRLGPAENVTNDTQLVGRPKYLNDRPEGIQSLTGRPGRGGTTPASDSDPSLRPEGLTKEEQRSLPTPAHLWMASPTGRPGQNTTSDCDPRL